MSSFRGRLDMVCVRGEQSEEMHSLAADKCDEMSFCNKPKIMAQLTNIMSNPSKGTLCNSEGGLLDSRVHC